MRRRVRIGEGIYRDQYGLAAIVKVGNVQRERRFPFDCPEDEMKAWQATVRAMLWEDQQRRPLDAQAPETRRGTLSAEIDRYAKQLEGRPSYAAERAHLRAWEPDYGKRRLAQIKPEDVALAIAKWRATDVAAQTIIHRCRVLRQLYHALVGPHARTPVDGVKRPPKPKTVPHTVPSEQIQAVLTKLHRAYPQTAARLWVLATTGQRPAHLMRATAGDVNLKKGIWVVQPAKRGEGRAVYLNPDMKAAWKCFIERKAWGEYDTTRHARLLRRYGWPEHIRPYNARHSFAAAALEAGVDLGDVQGLLGHADIDTTRRFYAAIVQARLKTASNKLAGRLPAKRASKSASGGAPLLGKVEQKRGASSAGTRTSNHRK
jgi:integrase